ncbi:MAG: family metallopeptidase [Glaciihabitans sp.]|nr:family metallopeptidase [Glaciihabitans sp.]
MSFEDVINPQGADDSRPPSGLDLLGLGTPEPPAATPAGQPQSRRERREREAALAAQGEPASSEAIVQATPYVAARPIASQPSAAPSIIDQPATAAVSRRDARASARSGLDKPSRQARTAQRPPRKGRAAATPAAIGVTAPKPAANREARSTPTKRRGGSRFVSFFALLFVAAFIFLSVAPISKIYSSAVAAPTGSTVHTTSQDLTVDSQYSAKVDALGRDNFSVISPIEVQSMGATTAGYTVNNSGPIRWPVPFAVPMGDMYGKRTSGCSWCSTFHRGIDFQPGAGAPIYTIADGVVSQHDLADPSLGNVVYITHRINGQDVTSLYAHMEVGSSTMKVGEKVKKGDVVGLVGSTGESTGPHLHFGILLGGPTAQPTDPWAWLIAHTAH